MPQLTLPSAACVTVEWGPNASWQIQNAGIGISCPDYY